MNRMTELQPPYKITMNDGGMNWSIREIDDII